MTPTSKLADKWIDIFRAGDHGDKGLFTDADVQQIVDNYDPAVHEAPSVIGHPKTDAPAYGWWAKLRRVGGLLQGQMRAVDPVFEEGVQAERYKKRSVSLYKGPRGYSLRHVGWLGAEPPHVKGLADVAFGSEDKAAIEIEFSEERSMALEEKDKQSIVDGIVNWFKGQSATAGTLAAATVFSEEDAKRIAAEAVAAAIKPLQDEIAAHKQTFSEQQAQSASVATLSAAQAAIARVKAKGAWVPAFDRMGVPELFAEVAKGTTQIEFSESTDASAAKVKRTPLEVLTTFMESVGKIVPTTTVYTGQVARPVGVVTFTESTRVKADPNSVALDQAVKERMSQRNVDYGTALNQVTEESPELCRPGGGSAGQV